jgi:hypothetical protein
LLLLLLPTVLAKHIVGEERSAVEANDGVDNDAMDCGTNANEVSTLQRARNATALSFMAIVEGTVICDGYIDGKINAATVLGRAQRKQLALLGKSGGDDAVGLL